LAVGSLKSSFSEDSFVVLLIDESHEIIILLTSQRLVHDHGSGWLVWSVGHSLVRVLAWLDSQVEIYRVERLFEVSLETLHLLEYELVGPPPCCTVY
jgi:hypothetical protein